MLTASKEFTNCWALHNAACANANNTSAKLSGAFREVSNRRATHEATCAEVKKASQRTAEIKRKATEAHEKISSHRERSRRNTNEHTRSEDSEVFLLKCALPPAWRGDFGANPGK